MTTHIFIVDFNTFSIHLEYMFAGTGGKNYYIDFNNKPDSSLYPASERNFVSMMADANRVRKGDNIIFYLQQNLGKQIREGKFYGIFKATSNWSFLDNNDPDLFLNKELGKNLNFRTLIEPYRVYPQGVTEWEALDEIDKIQAPNQMLWSLIYRKLKGNRGNTMITIYEATRLCQLIRDNNNKQSLTFNGKPLSFDLSSQSIIFSENPIRKYNGRKEGINLLPRLANKFQKVRAFEVHLQAYIIQNIGLDINSSLDKSVIGGGTIDWLGNEVSCGVGMQRIDIMLSVEEEQQKICMPIELKAVIADPDNTVQIQRYVDWVKQYYITNIPSDIQPVLVAKKFNDKTNHYYQGIINSFNEFNQNNPTCNKLKYIEYDLVNNNLLFEVIEY